MARASLGSLIVTLGLDAAEFITGLTKAELQSKRFADKLEKEVAAASRIAATAMTAAAGAALLMAKNIIADASALDDLSDSTGSSVESLSKLANQAKISGRDFASLESLMLKLAAGMNGVEEEGSNVGRALKAIGVNASDPAEALQQIAIALNKYADGTSKAALARDLFGKGGPAFLATLKDIAEAQDIAATTTTKQAAEAEALEKALRRLSIEGTAFKNVVLSDIVPPLTEMIAQFRDAQKFGNGLAQTIKDLANLHANPFADVPEQVKIAQQAVDKLKAGIANPTFLGFTFGTDQLKKELVAAERVLELAKKAQQRAFDALGYTGDSKDQRLGNSAASFSKEVLDYRSDPKAAKVKVDEFAKALEAVNKLAAEAKLELAAAFSGEQILPAQRALDKIKADDVWTKKLQEDEKILIEFAYQSIIVTEKRIQALKDERAEREKQVKAFEQIAEAQARAREAFTSDIGKYAEVNDVLAREIALIGADDLAHRKLAATLEYEALQRKAIAAAGEDMAEALRTLAILDQQYQKRLQLLNTGDKIKKQLDDAQQYSRVLEDAFGNAFTDFVSGAKSASDAFKALERDIVAGISRIAARNIADALFGGATGGGAGGALAKLFGGGIGALFGGPAPITDFPVPLGALAEGTDNWRGGWTRVGERGPEIVNLPKGAQVIPAHETAARREAKALTISQQINVLPGASRQSATQAAAAAAREARIAAVRNG